MLEKLHDPANLTTPPLDALTREFEKIWAGLPEIDELEEYKPLGLAMLQNYYRAHVPLREKVLAVEKRFTVPIENHTLTGVLDRVSQSADGTIIITDYKTSKTLPTQPEVDADQQMAIYYHFGGELYPGRPVLMQLHFLKFDFLFDTTPTEASWARAKERILGAASGIESRQFDPRPGGVCEYCDYVNLCPAMRHLFEGKKAQTEIFDGVDINEAVREYVSLKEEVKVSETKIAELAKKIEGYLDAKGYTRLFVDDIVLSRVKVKKLRWNEEKLEESLNRLHLTEKVAGIREDLLKELLSSGTIPSGEKAQIESCRETKIGYSLRYRFKDED
jgi:hypothetical protein